MVPAADEPCAALVVTYGERAELAVSTLRAAVACGAAEVVLVTNGVTAQTAQRLAAGTTELGVPVHVVELPTNTGSAGGFGAGFDAYLQRATSTLVWVLDDDNAPEPDALRRAVAVREAAVRELAGTGGAGGPVSVACFRPSDSLHAAVAAGADARRAYSSPGAFNHLDLRQRLARAARHPAAPAAPASPAAPARRTVPVPSAPYGGLLTSREQLGRLGLPRSDFLLYEDDTEFTERIAGTGGHLILALDAVVHDPDKETPRPPEDDDGEAPRPVVAMLRTPPEQQVRLYYQTRNTVYLDRRRARRARDRAWLVLNAAAYLAAVAVLAARDRRNRAALGAFTRAVRDGASARLGPHPHYPLA